MDANRRRVDPQCVFRTHGSFCICKEGFVGVEQCKFFSPDKFEISSVIHSELRWPLHIGFRVIVCQMCAEFIPFVQ